jgi:uncharacterized Zn finger protein
MSMFGWLRRLLRNRRYYRCSKCGWEVFKSEALLSGGPGYVLGWHVHCRRCGAVVARDLYFWKERI